MAHYARDRALICESGHVLNEYATNESFKHLQVDFCGRCGARAMSTCPSCSEPLLGGHVWIEHYGTFSTKDFKYERPAHCTKCGTALPWTLAALEAGRELADELDGLDDDDRERLKNSFEEIARETPQAEIAATRIKKTMAKLGGEGAKSIGRIAQSLATQAAKDLIFGPGA